MEELEDDANSTQGLGREGLQTLVISYLGNH
jgi:hypothetical protein